MVSENRKLPEEPSRRRKNTYSTSPGPDNIYEPIGYGVAAAYDTVINPPLGKIERKFPFNTFLNVSCNIFVFSVPNGSQQ